MKRYKLGKSISFGDDFDENVKKMKDAGFESIDFDLCRFWYERENEIELYKNIEKGLETIKNSGLYFNAVHISFGVYWDFSELDEEKRQAAVRRTEEIFHLCDGYKPFAYVLHGSFEGFPDEERGARISQLQESLNELREKTSAKICVEDLPRTCLGNTSDELIKIVDGVQGIDVCMDVNHLLYETPQAAVRKLGKRIKTTHISDYDFVNERYIAKR